MPDQLPRQSVSNADVLVFDMKQRRPACVLIAAAMGGNPSFAHEFPVESWIIDGDLSGLKRYGPLTREQVRQIAEKVAADA